MTMPKRTHHLLLLLLLLLPIEMQAQTAIISHRGYWTGRGSAQNSIEAIKRAYNVRGIYGVEIDVHLTQDSVVVLSHDADIEGYRIDKTDWQTLRDNVRLRDNERISTLDEMMATLKQLPGLNLFLEVKPQANAKANSYIAQKAVEAVQAYGLQDRVAYISFGLDICKELSLLSPQALVMYLGSVHSPKELHEMGLKGVNYNYTTFWKHPEWYDEARELGMKVGAWTVNEPATMKCCIIPRGFDFMTTDTIDPALDVFDRMGVLPKGTDQPLYEK